VALPAHSLPDELPPPLLLTLRNFCKIYVPAGIRFRISHKT
jgi:hypothetical protein